MRAAACALALAALSAPLSRADEEDVPFDELPKVVIDGFKERFPDAKPTGISGTTTRRSAAAG